MDFGEICFFFFRGILMLFLGIDDCFGQYDPEGERARVGAVVPGGPPGKAVTAPRRTVPTTTTTRAGGGVKPPGAPTPPKAATGVVAPRKPIGAQNGAASNANPAATRKVQPTGVSQVQQQMKGSRISGDQEASSAADQHLIQDLRTQLDEANVQIESTAAVIEGLERERDFYFSKLRDIEIIAQEHEDSGQLPDENVLKRIKDILYATEDGFIAPEDEEGLPDENLSQEELVDINDNVHDDDETY